MAGQRRAASPSRRPASGPGKSDFGVRSRPPWARPRRNATCVAPQPMALL